MSLWRGALLVLAGCAARSPVSYVPPHQAVHQFVIEAGEHQVVGTAIVDVTETGVTLQAISPAGLLLFQVEATAGSAELSGPAMATEMGPWLRRMPFARDLFLLYRWRCPQGRCRTPTGTLRRYREGLRWRGHGGATTFACVPDRCELTDNLRGYRLLVVGQRVE